MRTTDINDDVISSVVSHISSEESAKNEKMAASQNSSKSKGRKSSKSKRDEIQALEDKWENRFSCFESKMDKFMECFNSQRFLSTETGTGTGHGAQRHTVEVHDSSGGRRLSENENDDHFAVEQESNCQEEDQLSIAPGVRERHELGLNSDDGYDGMSVISHIDMNNNASAKTDRFHRYLKSANSDNKDSSDSHKLLNLFGEDAKTKSSNQLVGIILDDSQIEILSNSWHSQNPGKLTAYKDEYKACFPVHEKSLEHLEVPSLDKMVSTLLVKKHGNKAVSSTSKKNSLHTPFIKGIEKLAFQGQVAARMGIISTSYTQQALGT